MAVTTGSGLTSDPSPALTITIDATAPTFTSAGTATAIDENSGAAQTIYTAAATDDSSLSYSLKAGNNDDAAAFSIDATSGVVTLTADPDYETQGSYAFTVVATDAAGNSSDQAVALAINDLDDEPSFNISIAVYEQAVINHNWTTINISQPFFNPVVIASDPSSNEKDPVAVRIRNLDSDSFEIRLHEPYYKDGSHSNETVSWMVIEAGDYQLADGTRLSAGTTTTDLLSPQGFETVVFDTSFAAAPTVLSQIQTFNGADWAITRTDAITGSSFDLTMQEEEALNDGAHVSETIGWLAIDQGSANDGDTFLQAAITADHITHNTTGVSFAQSFAAAPALIAKLSSFDGADPANLRFTDLTNTGFSAIAAEEQSLDAELQHLTEQASYLALEGTAGTIEALMVEIFI